MDLNLFEVIMDVERSSLKFLESRSLRSSNYSVFELWSKSINKSVLRNLMKISKISQLVFNRYRDEYEKTKGNTEDDDETLVNNINQNMDFTIKLLLLMRIHREFLLSNTDNFDPETIGEALISFEENYNQLLSFYLEYSEMDLDLGISNLLKHIEEQNSNERKETQLSNLDTSMPINDLKIKLSKGKYYLRVLSDLVKEVQDDFWQEDLILSRFLNDRAVDILSQISDDKQEIGSIELSAEVEKIKHVEIPSAKAQSEYSHARFKHKIAKVRINAFEMEEANIELKSALGSLEKVFTEIGLNPKSTRMRLIQKEAMSLSEHANLLNLLVELNLVHNDLDTALEGEDSAKVKDILSKMETLLSSHDYNLDIEYLSAIPAIYDNLVNMGNLILETDPDLSKISNQIDSNFENMERRIITATNQIVDQFKTLTDEDKQETKNMVDKLYNQVVILQLTNSLLPKSIPSRNHNHNRLKILNHLAVSFDYELQAYFVSESNRLKELIFKTKAYYHANEAYFEFNNLGTQDVPIDRIKAHYSGSFIASNRLQIELYQSIAQYLCLNDVLPSLYLVLSFDGSIDEDKKHIYQSWQKRLTSLDLFENILKQIVHGSQILREHKQIHGSTITSINWDQIQLIEHVAKGINQFLNSLKELIMGTISLKMEMREDAIIHFTEAKSLAFTAAETMQILSKTNLEISEAPTLIYNYAKFCQSSASDPSSHDLLDIPITAAFKLLRDLVFAM